MVLTEDAQVTALLADYVGIDAAGKLNIIGGGFALIGIEPTGATPPFGLALIVEAPGKYAEQEFSLSIELRDETTGTVVQMPGPSGQFEALRVAQVAKFERLRPPPGMQLDGNMPVRIQVNIAFSSGLPLKPGTIYAWRVEIDSQHRKSWTARFAVPGAPPGLVYGGPAGPADIPEMPTV